jgi:ABC-type glycerol-3-phosphate transport system substrate-binding protein
MKETLMKHDSLFSRRQFLRMLMIGGGAAATPLVLAACGSAPGATNPTSAPAATNAPATTTVPATVAPAATRVAAAEVTHWDVYVTQAPTIEEEIRLFQAANPGITIKRTVNQSDKYDDLFALAKQGGDMPDVFLLPTRPDFQLQATSGDLADLTQFADWADFKAQFPAPEVNFLEGTNTFGGKTYSAPASSKGSAMWVQLYINTRLFKEAGLVDSAGNVLIPQTISDMLDYSRTIKEKSGGSVYGYGFSGIAQDWPGRQLYFAQLNGGTPAAAWYANNGMDYKTGKFTYATNPAYKKIIETLLTMRDEQLILPDALSVDDEAIRVLFGQHKFAMLMGGTWVVNGWKQTNPDFTEYTLTNLPLVDATTPTSSWYADPGGKLYGISAKAKNLEAAWKWFRWLYSKEAQERWVKSGNGTSIFSELNKPEYFDNEALRQAVELGEKYTRVGPQPSIRNPETTKLKLSAPTPNDTAIIMGLFTGQLTDIDAALAQLDAAKQQAFDTALSDAIAAGAKVSMEDFIFPDFDPLKDYATKANA